MKRINNTNGRLVDVIVFYPKKNIKLQPVQFFSSEVVLIPILVVGVFREWEIVMLAVDPDGL